MYTLTIGLLVMSFALLLLEFITKRGFFIWIAIGLLITTAVSVFFKHGILLIIIWLGSAVILFRSLNSWYSTYVLPAKEENLDNINIANEEGIVTKEVKRVPFASGKVEISGIIYTAVSKNERIEPGTIVVVEEVSDSKIYVVRK